MKRTDEIPFVGGDNELKRLLYEGGLVAIEEQCRACGQKNRVLAGRGLARCAKCGLPLKSGTKSRRPPVSPAAIYRADATRNPPPPPSPAAAPAAPLPRKQPWWRQVIQALRW